MSVPQESFPQLKLEDPKTKLVIGDCRDVLARLKPESVDCVFADPPYDNTATYTDRKDNLPPNTF